MDINTLLDTVFISSLSSHTIHWQKLQRRYLGQSVGLSLQTLDNILYILPPGISKVLAVVKTPTPKKICALLVHSVSAICSLELNQSGGSRSIVNSFTCHFVDRPSLVFRALEDPMTRMKDSPSMLYFRERRKACCYERRCLTSISANTLVNVHLTTSTASGSHGTESVAWRSIGP